MGIEGERGEKWGGRGETGSEGKYSIKKIGNEDKTNPSLDPHLSQIKIVDVINGMELALGSFCAIPHRMLDRWRYFWVAIKCRISGKISHSMSRSRCDGGDGGPDARESVGRYLKKRCRLFAFFGGLRACKDQVFGHKSLLCRFYLW